MDMRKIRGEMYCLARLMRRELQLRKEKPFKLNCFLWPWPYTRRDPRLGADSPLAQLEDVLPLVAKLLLI